MIVKIKDIRPNPYRNLEKYPLKREKIDYLKESIRETFFWKHITAREKNGFYELACGHHRIEALRELGIKEIDIPIEDISDEWMLLMMIRENSTQETQDTDTIVMGVEGAKKYLEDELKKAGTWEALGKNTQRLIDKYNFGKLKKDGVGHSTIEQFLRNALKEWQVKKALDILRMTEPENLDEPKIDKNAIYQIENLGYASMAANILKKHVVPVEKQKEIIALAKEKLELDRYESIKTGRVEQNKPRKEWKFNAAIEEAIEEKTKVRIKKENFDKVFGKKDKTPLINDVMEDVNTRVLQLNTILSTMIIKNLDLIEPQLKMEFQQNMSKLSELIEEMKLFSKTNNKQEKETKYVE
jgi:hypothetical protein